MRLNVSLIFLLSQNKVQINFSTTQFDLSDLKKKKIVNRTTVYNTGYFLLSSDVTNLFSFHNSVTLQTVQLN